jgi:hypothetical protein
MKPTLAEVFVQTSPSIKFLCALLLLGSALQSLAKPGASIQLQGPSAYQFEPHSKAALEFVFVLPKQAQKLDLQLHVNGDLMLESPATHLIELEPGQESLQLPVNVQTGENCRCYLMFNFVVHLQNGRTEARSTGVRIQVGDPIQAQKPRPNSSIKTLPAEETVY